MSILYTTIRTLILDKILESFFSAVVTSFSQFDILDGIREFDEILIFHQGKLAFRFPKSEIISIYCDKNGRFPLHFSSKSAINKKIIELKIVITKVISISEASLSVEA